MTQYITLKKAYPHYRHDCERCRWRGSFVAVPEHGEVVLSDVYVCTEERGETIIMRRGDDGPEYLSFPREIVEKLGGDLGADWQHALEMVRTFKRHRAQLYDVPSHAREDSQMPYRVDKTMRIDLDDDYGGRAVTFTLISWPSQRLLAWDPNYTVDAQEELIHSMYPATRCQHSYDCCGHYYASRARILKLPCGRWIVRQAWTQNV